MKHLISTLLMSVALATGCKSNHYAELGDGIFAEMNTNKGEIILKLEYEKAPVTVANFVTLAEGSSPFVSEEFQGKKYYDGLTFHRVMKDFMIQGGDPTATGTGNPGYRFADEFSDSLLHNRKGVLSMANGGPKTNGSQFFITHAPTPWLDGRHSVFGEVVQGIEVVDSIAGVPVAEGSNKPLDPVVMERVEIIRNGKEAKDFDAVAIMKNYFAQEEAAEAALKNQIEETAVRFAEQKATAESLPTGLKYMVVTSGEGAQPNPGDRVQVAYSGWLENGTLIDTSDESIARAYGKHAELSNMHQGVFDPMVINYSPDIPLIAGFKEALLKMQVGDKWRVFIPPHLGWGPQANGPIPANSDVVFDIELLGIAAGAEE